MRILVVDPNEAFATLLSEELKREGYDVDMCLDGNAALQSAQAQPVDLAILDMALAAPGAVAVVRQLQDIRATTRVMLIPLMGESLAPQADSLSIQGILPKPFFLPELPGLIDAALKAPLDGQEPAAPLHHPDPAPQPAAVVQKGAPVEVRREDAGLSADAFNVHRIEVERSMNNLLQDVGADTVLLTFDGGLLTWVGGLDQEAAESIARAVVHGWQTSAEVARILGREQVRFEQSIAGGDYMLYALSVEVNAIMGVAVRGAAPLGLLRHRARIVAEQIAELCKP